VSARAANWIAIVLLAFSSFWILGLAPPPDPDYDMLELAETAARNDALGKTPSAGELSQRYEAFKAERRSMWLESVLFFSASVFAALATFWRRQIGVWLVLLVCAYLLYVSGPPFARMAIDGGLINFASTVYSGAIKSHGVPTGLIIFWAVAVAPLAYALLALAAIWALWQAHGARKRESNL
jgi:hypothetical protein